MIRDYTERMSLVGKIRRAIHRLLGYDSELCQFCGRRYDGMLWWASPELWRAVMPYDMGLACPACFASRAKADGFLIVWKPEIRHVRDPLAPGEWVEPHPAALARHFGREIPAV